jgi:shikimate dehydrogenase
VTDRYVVMGRPVAHSQSPFIHTAFARQTRQDMEYGRLECPPGGFAATLRAFADEGGRGCNVTMPFKFDAWHLVQARTARGEIAGACNALRLDAQRWLGDNTDGVGLVRDLERNAGVTLGGRRVLLVGAGGAAAGVLGPLLAAEPSELVVANRTAARAQALLETHAAAQAARRARRVALRAASLDDAGRAYDIVINGTASSMQGADVPVPADALAPGALALDMMYGPAARPFIAWAEAHGAIGRDGLGMLVEQAAEAFELFRGVAPQTAPVLAALRRHLDASTG